MVIKLSILVDAEDLLRRMALTFPTHTITGLLFLIQEITHCDVY